MKVTDYIVEFLISKGITDVFGYPGGVICHFIDSLSKYDRISGHINYHEQGAAYAACGYAQTAGKVGVAYATSGPGGTNLVTGIANAYYDSIPTIFFTGQVDTYGLKGNRKIRQRGFQETDIVAIVRPITKYAVRIDNPKDMRYELEKAYVIATQGNPGSVLIDLPADVQRAAVKENILRGYACPISSKRAEDKLLCEKIIDGINNSDRPCILVGNGVKQSGQRESVKKLIKKLGAPVVFSMPAVDILPHDDPHNFGFIGANGHRYGNFVLGKSDFILAIGSRMDVKQVGNDRSEFAKQAKLVRIDIDKRNLDYKVHDDEIQIQGDLKILLPLLIEETEKCQFDFGKWGGICKKIKETLHGYDDERYTALISEFSRLLPDDITITADVGQSGVWIAQQFRFKEKQSFHISAGHGAMGYSLPAAIGVYYAYKKPVVSFNGDGGIQMNIQELQFLARERIPVTVVVINNRSLGMIRAFQEENFAGNYQQTTKGSGYLSPDFEKIANAYGMEYRRITYVNRLEDFSFNAVEPNLVEIEIPYETKLKPNFGKTCYIQDQRPYIDRDLYEEIMGL